MLSTNAQCYKIACCLHKIKPYWVILNWKKKALLIWSFDHADAVQNYNTKATKNQFIAS